MNDARRDKVIKHALAIACDFYSQTTSPMSDDILALAKEFSLNEKIEAYRDFLHDNGYITCGPGETCGRRMGDGGG